MVHRLSPDGCQNALSMGHDSFLSGCQDIEFEFRRFSPGWPAASPLCRKHLEMLRKIFGIRDRATSPSSAGQDGPTPAPDFYLLFTGLSFSQNNLVSLEAGNLKEDIRHDKFFGDP
jgi:hypothetical protein